MENDILTTPLTNSELQHLLDFVGYGNIDAEVWFLGMEEAGGGEENIRARLKFRQIEDCAEAHKILGITKHHFDKKVIQRTWRGMCYVMLRLEEKSPTTENIRNYQADMLGRAHGKTLLCELMPIPKPNIGSWDYDSLMPQFASRRHYYQIVKPRRIEFLKFLLQKYKPKIVIAYGKSYWSDYQDLFSELKFNPSGQFLIGNDEAMKVVLTDHFTARSMNGKLDEIVRLIESVEM